MTGQRILTSAGDSLPASWCPKLASLLPDAHRGWKAVAGENPACPKRALWGQDTEAVAKTQTLLS